MTRNCNHDDCKNPALFSDYCSTHRPPGVSISVEWGSAENPDE